MYVVGKSVLIFLYIYIQPQYAPEEVLYQGCVKFSCWDEQGKKCRERYAVLRDYKVEIHENMEVTRAHTHFYKQNMTFRI